MKRLIAAALLVLVGAAVAYGYTMTRREGLYRQYVVRGDYALARGDTFAAVSVFTDAIALKPESMLGYLKRGEARLRRGELDAAAEDLARASTLDPSSTRALELRGDAEAERWNHDGAAEQYAAYARLDDRSPRVLFKLGLARYRGGRYAEAADALTRAVGVDDRMAEAHYLRGVSLRELHRPRDAQRALERAITLSPQLQQVAREQLADLYGDIGQRTGRIGELEALLARDPHPSRQVALALAYAEAGQVTRAVRLLGNATQRYPEHAETYVALGRIWLDVARSGDHVALGKAVEALQLAVAMEPSSHALMLLGQTRLAANDASGAERVLRQATERLPADPLAFLALADAAERTGHTRVARRALLDYHSVSPAGDARRNDVARRIGDLSMRLREPRAADEWWERAGFRVQGSGVLGSGSAFKREP